MLSSDFDLLCSILIFHPFPGKLALALKEAEPKYD